MGGASPSDPRPPAHTKSSDPKLTTASPPSLPHRYNLSSRTETSFTQFLSLVYPFSELAICTPSSSSLSDSFLFPSLVLRSSAETTRSHSTSTSSERPISANSTLMAPPPSNMPLVERLKALAQTLQFAWFIGHVTLLGSVFRYLLSYVTFNYYSGAAQVSYRLAFVSAAVTYGIVVYKGHIARGRLQGSLPNVVLKLAGDENVQYLGMALVWLYSRQIPLALLPFSVYSVFHVATYTRAHLIPTLQPPSAAAGSPGGRSAVKQSPLAETIGRFVKQYYDASMDLVAGLEIALLFRLAVAILTFSKSSILLFIIYLTFFRARYSQSSFVQQAVRHFTARVDASVSHQSTPPAVRQGWEGFKDVVRQAYQATDVSRFTSGAGAKKPQ